MNIYPDFRMMFKHGNIYETFIFKIKIIKKLDIDVKKSLYLTQMIKKFLYCFQIF